MPRKKAPRGQNRRREDNKRQDRRETNEGVDLESWNPKTSLGRRVKNGEVTDLDQVLDRRERILEPQIVDVLLPNLSVDLLMVGQAKGKFGGGQERVFKQTQKKTREGNKPNFSTVAIVGNEDGYVGMGFGKSKETVPAREKAVRNSKLNIIKIRRGNGTWEDSGTVHNTIPFVVHGKSGSVRMTLIPAPRGTGLCVHEECKKILRLAGIKDVWSQAEGSTKTKMNMLKACYEALTQLMDVKVMHKDEQPLSLVEGKAGETKAEE